MRIQSIIFALLLCNQVFAQELVVKQVYGNVEFVIGEKRTVVENFSSFYDKSGVFISKEKNAQLFIRIDDKLKVLDFSAEKYKYTLKELIVPKKGLGKREGGFLDNFFSLFSVSHDDAEINGMIVAKKSGISRGFNDTNIVFIEEIIMIDGYPLKIDFGRFIPLDTIGDSQFNIFIKEKYTGKKIQNQTTTETYCIIETKRINNSLFTYWDIDINTDSSEKIKGSIKSFSLSLAKRKLLDELKAKAIAESKTDECIYQIIFIESLRSSGLLANASYYLDLFINTNNSSRLIDYKGYYTSY